MIVLDKVNCNETIENSEKPAKVTGNPWIYSPSDFDFSNRGSFLADHEKEARWFLNCIYFQTVLRNYDFGEYVNLHTDILAKVIKKELIAPLRTELIRSRLVDSDKHFEVGSKSIGYRIGQELVGRKWGQWTIKGKAFANKVKRYKDHVRSKDRLTEDIHLWLANWCDKVEWTADAGEVLAETIKAKPKAQHQYDLINEDVRSYSVCPYGRFHSNYTCLASEMRGCLQIQGERLKEIDVVSSQPYHLFCYLWEIRYIGKNTQNVKDTLSNCPEVLTQRINQAKNQEKNQKSQSINTSPQPSPPIPPHVPLFCDEGDDLGSFGQDILDGTIYETYQQAGGWETRQEAKKDLFLAIYGKDPRNLDILRTIYPSVAEMIQKSKSTMGYKWLPQEMQRRESHCMIQRAARRLMLHHPDIPIVTVHDSILTPARHVDTVKEVLVWAHSKNLVQPLLRIK